MKTLKRKSGDESLYVFADDVAVNVGPDHTTIGDPVELIISDCSTDTAEVVACSPVPDDWAGGKYLYQNETWAPNPLYTPPTERRKR